MNTCGVIAATLAKRLEAEPAHRPVEEELIRIIRDTRQTLGEFGH